MQKIYALALMLLFTFLQYGKLISYWNCKVTNSSDTRVVRCDCEKFLLETKDTSDPSLSSKMNIKDKTEECFTFCSVRMMSISDLQPMIKTFTISCIPPATFKGSIFQPPRNA